VKRLKDANLVVGDLRQGNVLAGTSLARPTTLPKEANEAKQAAKVQADAAIRQG